MRRAEELPRLRRECAPGERTPSPLWVRRATEGRLNRNVCEFSHVFSKQVAFSKTTSASTVVIVQESNSHRSSHQIQSQSLTSNHSNHYIPDLLMCTSYDKIVATWKRRRRGKSQERRYIDEKRATAVRSVELIVEMDEAETEKALRKPSVVLEREVLAKYNKFY